MSEVIVLLEALKSELCRQDVWLPMPPPVEANQHHALLLPEAMVYRP